MNYLKTWAGLFVQMFYTTKFGNLMMFPQRSTGFNWLVIGGPADPDESDENEGDPNPGDYGGVAINFGNGDVRTKLLRVEDNKLKLVVVNGKVQIHDIGTGAAYTIDATPVV